MNHSIKTTFILFIFTSYFFTGCTPPQEQTAKRRNLVVSLYPYLPNASDLYWKIETTFEEKFPAINLEIQLNTSYYYSQDSLKKRGISFDQADIYELDAVFLEEFINSGKIQAIPKTLPQNTKDYLPMASIAKRGETWYGVPHWVCGNFMFYKKGDQEVEKVTNLKAFEQALQNSSPKNGLLIDLKGKSTIGELYLDALFDEYGAYQQLKPYLDSSNINAMAVENLNKLLTLTTDSLGRIGNYHDRLGYYAREFAKREGRVYVGYAESSYYMITEQLQSCSFEDSCLLSEDIKIGEWSISNNGSNPIGWVDMFVIDANVNGQKLKDAQAFIQFMMQDDTYKSILIPSWNEAPRYILPAKDNLYSDNDLIKNAPLYEQFYPIIQKATSISDINLNNNLRKVGKKLDEQLLTN